MLGIAEGHSAPEETAWAIRRFLEILASERPVIAVWEDVHWAEPALLDAIDHVADWAGDAPILLLCTARPEFLDSRPAWGAGKQRASALTLPPLPADASTQLIANLLGGGRLPADAADRVAEAGGGNPLFVEQMVSMLIDDGLVVREDGGWTPVGDLSSIAVPPSVAALLAARLERLSDDERRAIGSASVIGKVFYVGAVRELLPEPDRANAGPLVRSLVRKELVRETRSTIPGEDAFEFRHILIRDAAYAAIPKERRAEQHRRFADWCVRIAGERIEELEEIVGYHLEQAFRNRESHRRPRRGSASAGDRGVGQARVGGHAGVRPSGHGGGREPLAPGGDPAPAGRPGSCGDPDHARLLPCSTPDGSTKHGTPSARRKRGQRSSAIPWRSNAPRSRAGSSSNEVSSGTNR